MPMPTLPPRHALALFTLLIAVMGVTRIHHFAAIPDASWAVFFVAGFYLRAHWRWAFPILMAAAVLADAYAIGRAGMDFWGHYCVSPAYWALLPSYLALWMGGAWLAQQQPGLAWRSLGMLCASFWLSVSVCYLLSNGSFYWFSDSWGGTPSVDGWFANLGHWYLPFLRTTGMYVAAAALLHAAALATGLVPLRTTQRPAT